MPKRKPMCIIKDCNHRGKRKIRIDIGPTLGDSVVAPEARIQTVSVCQDHLDLMSSVRDEEMELNYEIGRRPSSDILDAVDGEANYGIDGTSGRGS